MCPEWAVSERRSQVNRPFFADMDTMSALSILSTCGSYRSLVIDRLHTLILGQPPSTTLLLSDFIALNTLRIVHLYHRNPFPYVEPLTE